MAATCSTNRLSLQRALLRSIWCPNLIYERSRLLGSGKWRLVDSNVAGTSSLLANAASALCYCIDCHCRGSWRLRASAEMVQMLIHGNATDRNTAPPPFCDHCL
eukprot:1821495-Pleurochrysis_carterae.AAC.1